MLVVWQTLVPTYYCFYSGNALLFFWKKIVNSHCKENVYCTVHSRKRKMTQSMFKLVPFKPHFHYASHGGIFHWKLRVSFMSQKKHVSHYRTKTGGSIVFVTGRYPKVLGEQMWEPKLWEPPCNSQICVLFPAKTKICVSWDWSISILQQLF